MNNRIRCAAYVLLGVSIVLTLLLAYPEVNRSRAKARAVVPTADLRAGTTDTVEEKVTLHPANLNTRGRLWHWAENHSYCGPPDYLPKKLVYPPDIPGTVVAGFKNYYDKGAPVFGCPEGSNAAFRGAVWFDLSDIMKKAPPLHIAVQSATLNFKLTGGCPHELLYGTADWMKGYDENTLVPGDHVSSLGPCPPGMDGCHIDVSVETVVNNWLKGSEHGGYANYGFVFKGMQDADLHYENSDGCYSRYGDFSLILDYTYDKEPAAKLPVTYPFECRGIDSLKVVDLDGPAGFRWVGFTFIPGTSPARAGLLPGQCSWLDRGMRAGEPGTLAQAIEGAGGWMKELNSSDSYWTFNVYNAGGQLQATGAERSKKFFVPLLRTNYALAANGGKVFPSSTLPPNSENYVNDGELTGAGNAVWLDSTLGIFPDYLEVHFDGQKTIAEIDVITRQDDLVTPGDPKKLGPSIGKSGYGITAFDVQYWDDGAWVTVASVVGNDKVWRKFTPVIPVTTDKIRIQINAGRDNTFSRVVEVEAWGK